MTSDLPDPDAAYGYGHLKGRAQVQPEPFVEYLQHSVEHAAADDRLRVLAEREAELRTRAAALRERRGDIAARSERLSELRTRRDEKARVAAESRNALRDEQAARAGAKRGSVAHAVLYTLAGMVFVLGDLAMSHSVVADALQMTGWEAWVFAGGLALISVLLKPAYDRLVERPYRDGRTLWFTRVILTAAVCSGITLTVLGGFRFQAYGARQEQTALDQKMEAADAAEEPLPEEELQRDTRRIAELTLSTASSPLGAASFILSGLLFAAAGAICLSMGIHSTQDVVHGRIGPARRVRALQRAQERDEREHARLAQEAADRTAELERERVLLVDQPASAELEGEADALRSEQDLERERLKEVRNARLLHLFHDGYQMGQALLAAQPPAERPVRKRLRPFLAVRRAIRASALSSSQPN